MSALAGVSALVTGGTSGIGSATAMALAERGADVVVAGRDEQRGQQVVDAIAEAGGTADFIAAELRGESSARSLARAAVTRFGRIDVLVNNAGVFPFGPTEQMTEADFDAVFALNVRAPYFLVAELAPAMARRGHGAIVNVTTAAAGYGAAGLGLYGASKAALVLLTKAWAAEYGPHGGPGQRGQSRSDTHGGNRPQGRRPRPGGAGRARGATGHSAGDRRGDRLPRLGAVQFRPRGDTSCRRRSSGRLKPGHHPPSARRTQRPHQLHGVAAAPETLNRTGRGRPVQTLHTAS
ncbi:NAD(P)-dependent dehydrogenase (short-subunit alcohol dehydrogenase family) [Streptomyces rishiriensis]|uniref:NAD(P)-dependent dehydrogenase (Short-subunit alcohol dehydrogenase family) n=1 Tax=Streptomyces rishiriensis TaxID=68264 RepID=A0ABU0P2M6_STRRH|nr:NAD(P)-dependent dehydrogenase (short-subunit alcohol dehydrogenase family) [Streptomyces rishiriensis]